MISENELLGRYMTDNKERGSYEQACYAYGREDAINEMMDLANDGINVIKHGDLDEDDKKIMPVIEEIIRRAVEQIADYMNGED